MIIDIDTLRGLDAYRSARDTLTARLAELDELAAGQPFGEDQRAEFEEISGADGLLARVNATIEELEIRERTIQAAVREGGRSAEGPAAGFNALNVRRVPDNIFDLAAYRQRARSVEELPGAYRDGAMRVIEGLTFPTAASAQQARDRLAVILEKHRDEGFGAVSRRIIATSSPEYAEAFAEAHKTRHPSSRTMAVLQSYSDGSDGGFALPVAIDPTFINTSDGSVNPLRQPGWARIETITGKQWQAVTTGGVTAAYSGERTTSGAADGAPTDVDDPTAKPLRADVSVDVSLEYLQDYGAASLVAEVGRLISVAKDDLEAEKFFTGNGTTEPEGIVAAIIADTTSLVNTITNDVFALGDIDKLIGQVPPRFRSRAKMAANLAILQLIPAFGTAGQPSDSIYNSISKSLRGYPVGEASAMDDVATDAKKILLMGDFSHFVIVDRLGLTSRIVDSYDSSGRPTGNSSIYAAWRNTSKVLTFNAFRLLKVQ